MRTDEIRNEELQKRIRNIEGLLQVAKELLREGDFLQCAVRLQLAAEQGEFSELLMNVFDSVTIKEKS